MKIIKDDSMIKVYNDEILIIEEKSNSDLVLTINKLKKIIQDEYQLEILNRILYEISLSEVA